MALKRKQNDDAAQVGIGTMIVFIATILVAAVAAGVLIDTSQKLQDKSTRTGSDAVEGVGTSLEVVNVWGHDMTADGDIDRLYFDVRLASGASPVDVLQVAFQYTDGLSLTTFGAPATAAGLSASTTGEFWSPATLRDDDGSFADGVMNKDDLIRLSIDSVAGPDDLALSTDVEVDVNIDIGQGAPISVGFTTPSSFDSDNYIPLF